MPFVKKWKTNVITHIPEDIHLELTDGVLTLKAGSKVYVPNGFEDDGTTPKFDVVVVTSDLILTKKWGTAEQMAIFLLSDNSLFQCGTARLSSGTTAPTATTVQVWYDTTNNIIRRYSGGSEQGTMQSLPIAICTKTSGNTDAVLASIDQVCNGFSYIGSTVFALPGVKGLMPNGINADGSLSNIEFTTKSLMQMSYPASYTNFSLYINEDGLYLSGTTEYDKDKNYNIDYSVGSYVTTCEVGTVSAASGKITSFTTKKVGEGYSKNKLYAPVRIQRKYYKDGVEVPSSSITDFGSTKYYKNIVTTKYWKEITISGEPELEYACYSSPYSAAWYGYAKAPIGSSQTLYTAPSRALASSSAELSVDSDFNWGYGVNESYGKDQMYNDWTRYTDGDLYIDTTVTEVVEGTPEDYTYTTEETATVEVTAEDDYDFTEFVPSTQFDFYEDGHKLYTPVLDEIKYYKHTYEDWEQPVLTSATSSKKVTITSTSDYGEGYYNWRVFDGGSTPWLSGNGTGQGSIRMQFPRPLKISQISVTGWSNPNGGTGHGTIYKDFNNTEVIGATQYFGGWVERVWTFDTPVLTDKLSFYITGTGNWGCASEINITAQEQLVTETTEAEAEWSERIIKVY